MELSITKEDMRSYAEVNYIINHMNERYFDKIPQKIKDFLYIVKDDSYETTLKIDPATPLTKQGISQYALEVIAIFHLKYWCENDEIRRNLLNRIEDNHRKFEEQLRAKYSVDFLDNSQKTSSSSNIYQGFQDFEKNVENVNAKSIQDIKANKENNYEEIEKAAEMADSQKEFEQTVQDVNTSSAKNVQKAAEELTELSKQSSFKNFVMNIINTIKDMFKKKEVLAPAKTEDKVENPVQAAPVEQPVEKVEEVKVEEIKQEVSSN